MSVFVSIRSVELGNPVPLLILYRQNIGFLIPIGWSGVHSDEVQWQDIFDSHRRNDMTDPRMNITYDFVSNKDYDDEDKERYARPILDGDNENYYGFGYNYEDDDVFPVFVDGLDVDEFFRRWDAAQERRRKRQD